MTTRIIIIPRWQRGLCRTCGAKRIGAIGETSRNCAGCAEMQREYNRLSAKKKRERDAELRSQTDQIVPFENSGPNTPQDENRQA